MISTLHNFFQRLKAETTLPNSFYEARMALISKPDKDIASKEKQKPVLLRNQNPQKYISNITQQYIKIITHFNRRGFIPAM